MRWSFRILTVAGIGVYLHITFLLLIAWIAALYFLQGGAASALQGTALVISVFGCVLLHELGHALTAKRFGIKTKDIILLPIGGVARLERIPREPARELLIAIAGPLVNVVIAGALYGVLVALDPPRFTGEEMQEMIGRAVGLQAYLLQLFYVNVAMAVFNMIPAFPMDGGRILRALLGLAFDYTVATRIAATVGQGLAIFGGLVGIFQNHPMLLLIAVFVFLGAAGEAAAAQLQAAFRGLPTATGMIIDFKSLRPDDTLGTAVGHLLSGSQVDFPVIEEGNVTGVLTRQQLVLSLKERGPDAPLREVPLKKVEPVDSGAPLFKTYEEMGRQAVGGLPVLEDGRLVGWITSENIAEVAMVREALGADRLVRRAGG
jgi:Zn-dependent protease/CBS domain-containing protein